MIRETWNKIVKFLKKLFKSKNSTRIDELTKRVNELEAINKQNEEYRKNKVRKFNNKKKDKLPY